jgi:hypothetical protein
MKAVLIGTGTFLKMACLGHLTEIISQEMMELGSRGRLGAEVPDLNLRLVGDFIFHHDSKKADLTGLFTALGPHILTHSGWRCSV